MRRIRGRWGIGLLRDRADAAPDVTETAGLRRRIAGTLGWEHQEAFLELSISVTDKAEAIMLAAFRTEDGVVRCSIVG